MKKIIPHRFQMKRVRAFNWQVQLKGNTPGSHETEANTFAK